MINAIRKEENAWIYISIGVLAYGSHYHFNQKYLSVDENRLISLGWAIASGAAGYAGMLMTKFLIRTFKSLFRVKK